MLKLLQIELKKLNLSSILVEIVVYFFVILAIPLVFILFIDWGIGDSYSSLIELVSLTVRMSLTLFGASMISQVVIEEYKRKTITLVYAYPIKRKKIFMVKITLICLIVFLASVASYLLTGGVIYGLDLAFGMIPDSPTGSDITTFMSITVLHSLAVALISLTPLFYFGVIRKGTVATVICAIVLMQIQNVSYILDFQQQVVVVILSLIGLLSAFLTVNMIEKVGD